MNDASLRDKYLIGYHFHTTLETARGRNINFCGLELTGGKFSLDVRTTRLRGRVLDSIPCQFSSRRGNAQLLVARAFHPRTIRHRSWQQVRP